MTRRVAAIEIELLDDGLKLRSKGRTLTIANAARLGNQEEDAEFLVLLDEIGSWDAPDDQTLIEIEELPKILGAIEDFAARQGFSIAFE
ncbi:MAG TPA: Imm74 family immunity protein [Methylocystis sp.]|nr:Imm74 family immunity protein [Methylocystis sp.]